MDRNEYCGRTGGHKGEVQTAHQTVHAEESDTRQGGSCRDRGRHNTPAASGLCRAHRGTLWNTHVPNLHPQGRGSQRLGWQLGSMEAKLPCAHDFRLDGRGNGKNPEAEQAGHGGDADHTGGMSRHGKGDFLRQKTPFRNPVQEHGRNRKSGTNRKRMPSNGG